VNLGTAGPDALERLIDLGALDVEASPAGGGAALMPDSVTPAQVAAAVGKAEWSVAPAVGRDEGSVWVLSPRPVLIAGRVLHLVDAEAFGTGLHPTTALCLAALQDVIAATAPERVLDVGIGSGVLALGALLLGVADATGLDIDSEALRVAGENARLNGLTTRLHLARGGPESVTGTWPLVLANVLAAPLIEMAPALVRRVGHHGRLVLSGIPRGVEPDVDQAYRRLGMQRIGVLSRGGWVALVLHATW
jgi:ribosomal protein L11 methyltransferase